MPTIAPGGGYPNAADPDGTEVTPVWQSSAVKLMTILQIAKFVFSGLANAAVLAVGGIATRTLTARFGDCLTPEDFGAKGDATSTPGTGSDDSAAVQAWVSYLMANNRKGLLRAYYRTTCLTGTSGSLHIQGIGAGKCGLLQAETTLTTPAGLGSKGTIYVNSGAAGTRLGPFTFRDFDIIGDIVGQGFEEHTHLMSLNGVDNVKIERMRFIGARGDCLYIGSGIVGGDERHNVNVQVRGNLFDGVNKGGRNGISILDYDGLEISSNKFQNLTQALMPGAIDFEPDAGSTFAVTKGGRVALNDFFNIGGNAGTITVAIPAGVDLPSGLVIEGNTQHGTFRTFLLVDTFRTPSSTDKDMGLVVVGNMVSDSPAGAPFLLYGAKGVTLRDNTYRDLAGAANIGANYKCLNITVRDQFIRVGSGVTPYGIIVNDADTLTIASRFEDCGGYGASGLVGGSAGVRFAAGTTTNVTFDGSSFVTPQGFMAYSVLASGNTFTPSTNRFFRNIVGTGLTNQFQAIFSDSIWTAFTPVLTGGVSAGAGTYTTQEGEYQINGAKVSYRSRTIWTAHTGTGQMYAPTPTNTGTAVAYSPAATEGNNLTAVATDLAGLVHNNRVQVYQRASGALTSQAIVAAGELYIEGEYAWAP